MLKISQGEQQLTRGNKIETMESERVVHLRTNRFKQSKKRNLVDSRLISRLNLKSRNLANKGYIYSEGDRLDS